MHTIDYYSIAINKTSPEQALYNGCHGNSQLDLSIIFSSHAINCTDRDDEYGHYVCDSYGNKICKNGYINPKSNCTTKIGKEIKLTLKNMKLTSSQLHAIHCQYHCQLYLFL